MSLVKELEKSGKNSTDVRTLLTPLRQLAVKIVGDEYGTQVIEDCAICLLLNFLDQEINTSKNLSTLGFGNIDPLLAKEAQKASSLMHSECLEITNNILKFRLLQI